MNPGRRYPFISRQATDQEVVEKLTTKFWKVVEKNNFEVPATRHGLQILRHGGRVYLSCPCYNQELTADKIKPRNQEGVFRVDQEFSAVVVHLEKDHH